LGQVDRLQRSEDAGILDGGTLRFTSIERASYGMSPYQPDRSVLEGARAPIRTLDRRQSSHFRNRYAAKNAWREPCALHFAICARWHL